MQSDDFVQALRTISRDSTTIDASEQIRRSTRGPRVPETTGRTSGVPITRSDWSYREDLLDDGGPTGAPSKRSIKHRSGRSGRRMYRNQQWLKAVGGYANPLDAIAAPPDKELCVVVDPRVGYKADGSRRLDPR